MKEQIEKRACKNCIHYPMCVDTFRKAKQDGDILLIEEEAYFADANGCDFYADKRIYRKQIEGEWIVTNSDGVWHYDCPFCDDGYAQKEKLPAANYCENCGARLYDPKMKGATDERAD